MPLVALENGVNKVFAWDVTNRAPLYTCKGCGSRLVFMDCRHKIKYFRHYEQCNCDSEPETPLHVWGKKTVYETIRSLKNYGSAIELEYPIDNLKADVYWESTWRKVAIEIQASNYTIDVFEDKIYEYAKKRLNIIYLFIGDKFLKQTKPNVYSLKEIEKQLFVTKELPGLIHAGYLLPSGKVFIPAFSEKWKHGGGDCSHRFISFRGGEKTVSLIDFLIDAVCAEPPEFPCKPQSVEPPKVACKHEDVKHVANFERIKRYKVVCSECDKFIKWLPNKEALQLGYSLD
jgi:hypothetical protein